MTIEPSFLDFGTVSTLEKITHAIKIENDSPITAIVEAYTVRNDIPFFLSIVLSFNSLVVIVRFRFGHEFRDDRTRTELHYSRFGFLDDARQIHRHYQFSCRKRKLSQLRRSMQRRRQLYLVRTQTRTRTGFGVHFDKHSVPKRSHLHQHGKEMPHDQLESKQNGETQKKKQPNIVRKQMLSNAFILIERNLTLLHYLNIPKVTIRLVCV